MAYSNNDFLSWDDDIDLENLLGDYTADENEPDNVSSKQYVTLIMCALSAKRSIKAFLGLGAMC